MFYFKIFVLLLTVKVHYCFMESSDCLLETVQKYSYYEVYFPPSKVSYFPRLYFVDSLPKLREFTFSARIRPHQLNNAYHTIVSYATARTDNELLITLKKNEYYNSYLITVRIGPYDAEFYCNNRITVGDWNHISVTWFGPNGNTKVYVDYSECDNYSNGYGNLSIISPNRIIEGNGVFIIGQEQDTLDGKFDRNQAWIGEIADIQLWDQVLNRNQINTIGQCYMIPLGFMQEGNVISFMDSSISMADGAILSKSKVCNGNGFSY